MSSVIKSLTQQELLEALKKVDRASDMLPPREDDKVAGRIAPRFTEGIRARIADDEYQVRPATFVPVPKRALTTRPAAIVSLRDRIVLEALVERTRKKITKFLAPPDTTIWPRADNTSPSWDTFQRAPLSSGGGYVASADVAGFYESVDHRSLALILTDAGVSAGLVSALRDHLTQVMGTSRGLPQGVESSDSLATLYLAPVDGALQRLDIEFWRHGDDYRLIGSSYAEAQKVVFHLEQAARAEGLLLNSGKLGIESFNKYRRNLRDIDRATAEFHEKMRQAREEALYDATDEALADVIDRAGIDEDMQWRFWYHHTVTKPEMIRTLGPSLAPKPVEVVAAMFEDLMRDDPDEELPPTLLHARLTFCLRRLAGAKANVALPHIGSLLVKHPDHAQDLANYMLAFLDSDPDKVVAACQFALTTKVHLLDWERAWIYRVLSRVARLAHTRIIREAEAVAQSDAYSWIARAEALRLLARRGCLSKDVALRTISRAPEAIAGDLAGVVAIMEPAPWAKRFLDGSRQDALHAVVVDAVREKMRSESSA